MEGAPLVSTTASKVKRTPVTLNYSRRPASLHFKVLQWNILADGLAQHGDFCKVPPGCLEWEYRKPLLLQEIFEANADIICLQELNHFEDLRKALKELGYDGAFREKRASPALKYEYPPDGMAVFYRRDRFACDENGIEGRSFQDDSGREQSQGYLQILLHDTAAGRPLLVVTTHLKAKDGAECEGMRLQQAQQLLGNIAATLHRLEGQGYAEEAPGGPAAGAAAAETAAEAEGGAAGGGNGCGGAGASGGNGHGHGTRGNGNGCGTANGSGGAGVEGTAVAAAAEGGDQAGASGLAAQAAGRNGCGGSGAGHGGGRCGRGAVPVVVTGDFNTLPASMTCQAFRSHPLGLLSLWEQQPLDATLSSSDSLDPAPPPPLPPPPPAAPHPSTSPAPASASSPSKPAPQTPQPTATPSAGAGAGARQVAGSHPSEFSTWKFRVKGESKRISDYIWYSGCGALRPLSRWRMLTEAEIGPCALPSSSYASDHVSLCCEFEWDVDVDVGAGAGQEAGALSTGAAAGAAGAAAAAAGRPMRLLETSQSKIFKVVEPTDTIDTLNDAYWQLRAEFIPPDQVATALGPMDRVVGIAHMLPPLLPSPADVAANGAAADAGAGGEGEDEEEMGEGGAEGDAASRHAEAVRDVLVNTMPGQTFGDPILVRVAEGETMADLKAKVQATLGVPPEEFAKWHLIFVGSRPPNAVLDDDHNLTTYFSHHRHHYGSNGAAAAAAGGPTQSVLIAPDLLLLACLHDDKGGPARRQPAPTAGRYTYEKPVKIYG